jgi:hypothetical protein
MNVMSKYIISGILLASVMISSCKKNVAELEANNIPFEETHFTITENITMNIPNTQFNWIPNFANCVSIPFGGSTNFNVFIPTQNPNPYAHIVDEITPTKVRMELTNITDCDFNMLKSVEIYLVSLEDSCGVAITNENQLVFPEDNVTYINSCGTPHAAKPYFNAVKIGDKVINDTPGLGNIIELNINSTARLDRFIHAEYFQTYAKLVFDKTFTRDFAVIKTTMSLDVRMINEE